MIKAFPGLNNSQVTVNGSKTLALSFFNQDGSEKSVENSTQPFLFSILMDIALQPFMLLNKSNNSFSITFNNLLTLDGFLLNRNNVSIHYQIKSNNSQTGYFAALRFGGNPYLMGSSQQFDLWNIFCPKSSKYFN